MKNCTVTWVPHADFFESEKEYVLNMELPGVEIRDIQMDISGNELTISGERRYDARCTSESITRLEGHCGGFHRAFLLPKPVDKSNVRMNLKDGILNVVLLKKKRKAG